MFALFGHTAAKTAGKDLDMKSDLDIIMFAGG